MNKRIEELKRSALEFAKDQYRPGRPNEEIWDQSTYENRLIWLVVEECAGRVADLADSESSDLYYWAIQEAVNKIFGVVNEE